MCSEGVLEQLLREKQKWKTDSPGGNKKKKKLFWSSFCVDWCGTLLLFSDYHEISHIFSRPHFLITWLESLPWNPRFTRKYSRLTFFRYREIWLPLIKKFGRLEKLVYRTSQVVPSTPSKKQSLSFLNFSHVKACASTLTLPLNEVIIVTFYLVLSLW